MKLIIAGSRDLNRYDLVNKFANKINDKYNISHIVSGAAHGIDLLGEQWARENNKKIISMPANWSLGPKAGPIRNLEMLNICDIILVIMHEDSRGSSHMSDIGIKSGKPTYIYNTTTKKGQTYNVEVISGKL